MKITNMKTNLGITFILISFMILMTSCNQKTSVQLPTGSWVLVSTYTDQKANSNAAIEVGNMFNNIAKKQALFNFNQKGVFTEKTKLGLLSGGYIIVKNGNEIMYNYNENSNLGTLEYPDNNSFTIKLDNGKVMEFERSEGVAVN